MCFTLNYFDLFLRKISICQRMNIVLGHLLTSEPSLFLFLLVYSLVYLVMSCFGDKFSKTSAQLCCAF